MKLNFITGLAYILIFTALGLALWFLILGGYFGGDISEPDPSKAKDIQPFITGLVLPLLTLGSTLLVIANLQSSNMQNLSNNFFKLIDQHHKLVDNINTAVEDISTLEKPSKGREFFDDLANRIANDFTFLSLGIESQESVMAATKPNQTTLSSLIAQSILNFLSPLTGATISVKENFELDPRLIQRAKGKSGKDLLLLVWDHYYHIHQSDLGHYFRNLYHIIQFIERAQVRQSTKVTFVKMLRAQLSNYELLLLAYNGMNDYGAKFYPLIEKYELLKNLNSEHRVPDGYERRIVDTAILSEIYPHLKSEWNKVLANQRR